MRKKYTTAYFTFFSIACIFCSFLNVQKADAARIYVDTSTQVFGVGDTIIIPIKFDAEGENINAISADLIFPDVMLDVVELRDNNSIITNWVDAPVVSGNSISFSGIIPGGFDGVVNANSDTKSPATILSLVVKVTSSGKGSFQFEDAHVYKNDGLGTETKVTGNPAAVTFSNTPTGTQLVDKDTTPPEPFDPHVVVDSNLYNGRFTVVFNTTDKESGIAYYEVSEEYGEWQKATSPYLLKNQSFAGVVRVRAVDFAGNSIIESVGAPLTVPTSILSILFLSVIALFFTLYYRYTYMRRKKKNSIE